MVPGVLSAGVQGTLQRLPAQHKRSSQTTQRVSGPHCTFQIAVGTLEETLEGEQTLGSALQTVINGIHGRNVYCSPGLASANPSPRHLLSEQLTVLFFNTSILTRSPKISSAGECFPGELSTQPRHRPSGVPVIGGIKLSRLNKI